MHLWRSEKGCNQTNFWEQRKLGEVATFINGRAYSQDELLSNGKYKVLRVGNFYTNDSWYFSDMELDEKYYQHFDYLIDFTDYLCNKLNIKLEIKK